MEKKKGTVCVYLGGVQQMQTWLLQISVPTKWDKHFPPWSTAKEKQKGKRLRQVPSPPLHHSPRF